MPSGAFRPIPSAVASDEQLLERVHRERDAEAREEVIRRGLKLVHHLAVRFSRPGVSHEELVQVGSVGLVNAVDRFDPDRGVKFSSFAVPYISGEIRRYFLDHSGLWRVTRSVQENLGRVSAIESRLAHDLDRAPTVSDVAEAAGLTEEEVLEALESRVRRKVDSLDVPVGSEDGGASRGDFVPSVESGYSRVDDRLTLEMATQHLPPRDREALALRFEDGLTQREIANALGVSQMHVSRCIRRALADLHDRLASDKTVLTDDVAAADA